MVNCKTRYTIKSITKLLTMTKPSLQILSALEAAYQQSFSEEFDATFTEANALREIFDVIDNAENFDSLREEAKAMALFNWRLAQRSCLNTILHLNIFRNLLETETIINHLYTIRNDQTRGTVAEIKAEFLDRILDEFIFEVEEILHGISHHDSPDHMKLAFMNCDPTDTIITAMELAGKLVMLDAELETEPIELIVPDVDKSESISNFTLGK
jgi:hypothetical protein